MNLVEVIILAIMKKSKIIVRDCTTFNIKDLAIITIEVRQIINQHNE